jgi:hypothetical protein
VDVEYTFDDPDDGWFGAAEPAQDATRVEHSERSTQPSDDAVLAKDPAEDIEPTYDDTDTDRWFVPIGIDGPLELEDRPREDVEERPVIEPVPAEPEGATTTRGVVPTRRNGFVRAAAPPSWESRLSNSGAWDFKATSNGPRLGSRAVVMAAAVVAGAAAAFGAVLLLRSPAPAVQDSTTAPPSQSAPPPAPMKSTPFPSAELPPPLPPPPAAPPPPSAEQVVPPVTRQYNPSYQTPDEPRKPQTNVTRTPMSATPPAPPRQTDQGHATPGDSRRHGFFG